MHYTIGTKNASGVSLTLSLLKAISGHTPWVVQIMFFPTNFGDTETVRIASMHAVPPFPAWSLEQQKPGEVTGFANSLKQDAPATGEWAISSSFYKATNVLPWSLLKSRTRISQASAFAKPNTKVYEWRLVHVHCVHLTGLLFMFHFAYRDTGLKVI